MVRLKRVKHLILNVSNLQKSTDFYTDILGFQIDTKKNISTFLTCTEINHDLTLFQLKATHVNKTGLQRGLNHIVLQVEDFGTLTEYYNILEMNKVEIKDAIDYGMTSSISFQDPDGNGIDLFCNNQDIPKDELEITHSSDGLEIIRPTKRKKKKLIFAHVNSF